MDEDLLGGFRLVVVGSFHELAALERRAGADERDAEAYRVEYNTVRPHEHLSWNRPLDIHTGLADPRVPNFPEPEILPTA